MKKELKQCPFCNRDAEIEEVIGFRKEVVSASVTCKKCGVSTKSYATKDAAIEAWNTRKPMDEILGKLRVLFDHHRATKIVQRLVFEIVNGER